MKLATIRSLLVCTVVLGAAAFVQQSSAVPVPPAPTPTISGMVVGQPELGVFMYQPAIEEFEQDGKKWKLKYTDTFEGVWMGSADITVEEIEYDPDPIVYNNLLVYNTSGGDQTYSFTISLPTSWAGPLQIRGSIDTSVIGPNALLQAAPTNSSVYTALIDSTGVATLQNGLALGTGQPATSQTDSFGWSATAVSDVNTDIAINLKFTLSNGATAAIISDFEVIPEPASIGLIGLVSAGIYFARRFFAA